MVPAKHQDQAIEAKPIGQPDTGKVVSAEYYEGVIPHPRLMKEWDQIVPGSAKSIFTRFESQSDHRIESEKKIIQAHNFKLYMGPIFAFIIAMTAIGGGIWIATVSTQPIVGGLLSLSGLATVIAPFLLTEIRTKKDRPEDSD